MLLNILSFNEKFYYLHGHRVNFLMGVMNNWKKRHEHIHTYVHMYIHIYKYIYLEFQLEISRASTILFAVP